jgi:peptidoglycan/LPS O-acetylase OafA/YrhL
LYPDASAAVRHIPALDGLRGLAALIVAVSHLSAMTGIAAGFFGSAGGQLGVILFFALSGFLMAHMYFEAPFSLRNLGQFAVARVARVVPLFLLVVLVSYAVTEVCEARPGCPWVFPMSTQALIDHLLLRRGEGVMWTIPVELKFYALFPFFWLLYRLSRPIGATAITGLLLLYFWLPPGEMPVMRLGHYFLLGIAVCLVTRAFGMNRAVHSRVLELGGTGALVCGILLVLASFPGLFWMLFNRAPKIWWEPIVLMAIALLLLGAIFSRVAQFMFGQFLLPFLGQVSYSLYLTHMLVYQNMRGAIDPGHHPWLFAVLSLSLAILLATAIYHLFESPMRHRLRRVLTRPWLLRRSSQGRPPSECEAPLDTVRQSTMQS